VRLKSGAMSSNEFEHLGPAETRPASLREALRTWFSPYRVRFAPFCITSPFVEFQPGAGYSFDANEFCRSDLTERNRLAQTIRPALFAAK
jgi:hypothetical protein